jgi:hypothetical protein
MQFPSPLRIVNPLSIILVVLVGIASACGAFLPMTYDRETASLAAQGVGQDFVNLFVAIPGLLISLYYMNKGRPWAWLVYGGTLFYLLYSYVIYALGIHFNYLFLVYCLALGHSIFLFIFYFRALERQGLESWFGAGIPVKGLSIFLALVAVLFYGVWLADILPALAANEVPSSVADYKLLVNPVHVIDLAFALPGLVIAALLLWQKKPLGYALAAIALVFVVLMALALVAMSLLVAARGIAEDHSITFMFGGMTLLSLIGLGMMVRTLNSS